MSYSEIQLSIIPVASDETHAFLYPCQPGFFFRLFKLLQTRIEATQDCREKEIIGLPLGLCKECSLLIAAPLKVNCIHCAHPAFRQGRAAHKDTSCALPPGKACASAPIVYGPAKLSPSHEYGKPASRTNRRENAAPRPLPTPAFAVTHAAMACQKWSAIAANTAANQPLRALQWHHTPFRIQERLSLIPNRSL
jgi:hypothetical protein